MSNHTDNNNPNHTDKSSLNAGRESFLKVTLPLFIRQWGWLAGVLGFFLLVVAVSWNVTISRAAHYNQPGVTEGANREVSSEAPASSSGRSEAQLNVLVSQIQELITVIKENDQVVPEAEAILNQVDDPLDSYTDSEVGANPVDPKSSAERFFRGYQRNPNPQDNRPNSTAPPQQQKQKVDPNAVADSENMGMSQEEQELFDLFEQYATAMEKDPDSVETQRLSDLLDAAMERLNERMESDPNATMGILGGAQVDPKQQQQEEQEPPVEVKQATGEDKPPVEVKQTTGEETPPVVEQQQGKTVEAPERARAAGEPPPPGEKKEVSGKTADPEKQAGAQVVPPPKEQQVAAHVAAAGRAGGAGGEKPLVTETIIRAQKPTSANTNDQGQINTQASKAGGTNLVDASDLQAGPNDIMELTIEDFQLDIEMLIELIGKEFKLTFLYQDPMGVTGTYRFQQYGPVRRRDLMPLLESILTFKGFTMVREGSYIHVVKRADAERQTEPLLAIGMEMPEVKVGDSIITQIVEINNTTLATVNQVLTRFVSTPQSVVAIPNTNYVIITEFTKRMPRVLDVLELIDRPGAPRRLISIPIQYISADQASSVLQIFLRELSGVPTPGAGAAPQPQARDSRGRPVPATQGTAGAVSVDTFFYVDSRTDRLFIIGTDEQIEQVKYLLELIDTEQLGAKVQLVSLEVTHIKAADAINQIDGLLKSINELRNAGSTSVSSGGTQTPQQAAQTAAQRARELQQRAAQQRAGQPTGTTGLTKVSATGPFMHVHERLNSIFVVGVEDQINQIKELLDLIDVPAGPQISLVALPVKYVSINEVQTQIEQLTKALNSGESSDSSGATETPNPAVQNRAPNRTAPGIQPQTQGSVDVSKGAFILPDEKNLRLLVVGSDEQINQIKELLALLDVSEGPEINLVPIPIRNVSVTDIEGQIQQLLTALNDSGASVGSGGVGGERAPTGQPNRPAVPTGNRAQQQAGAQTGTSGSNGPVIVTDENNRRLLIVGTVDQITQVRELVALLDVVEGPEIELVPIRITNVPTSDIVTQIRDLLDALNETGAGASSSGGGEPAGPPAGRTIPNRGIPAGGQPSAGAAGASSSEGPVIISDERNMRILVVGSAEQIKQVKELVALLDVIEGPEIKINVVRARHVPIPELVDQMDKLLRALNDSGGATPSGGGAGEAQAQNQTPSRPVAQQGMSFQPGQAGGQSSSQGPYILADERNARIIVVGSDAQMEQVREILALLDVAEGPEIKLEALYVTNVPIPDIVGQIDDLLRALNETPNTSSALSGGEMPMTGATGQRTQQTGRANVNPMGGMMGSQAQMSSAPVGPYIMPDERNRRLLVVGSEEQINQVKELLALLDVIEGPKIELVTIPVEHLPINDLFQQLQDLLDVLNENMASSTMPSGGDMRGMGQTGGMPSGMGNVGQMGQMGQMPQGRTGSSYGRAKPLGAYILPDERNRRLLVVGSEAQIEQVRELMTMLDVIEGPEIFLQPVRIQHVWADEVAAQLSDLLQALNEKEQSSFGGQGTGFNSNLNFTGGASRMPGGMNQVGGESGFEFNTGVQAPTQTQRRQTTGAGGGKLGPDGPFIFVDPKSNRLLIVGTQEQIDQILELLNVLDVMPESREKLILKVYHPAFIEVAEVEKILTDLGLAQSGSGSGEQAGRSGSAESLSGQGSIIQSSTPSGDLGFSGFDGQAVATGPQEPEIRIAIQETSNRLFVLATEYQLRDIDQIIQEVDVELEDALGALQIYKLDNQEPADVKDMLERLFDTEREVQGVDTVTYVPGKIGAPSVVDLEQSHAIAVRASSRDHELIASLLETLDKRPAQVLVEAILVQVSTSESLKLGINLQQAWDVGGLRSAARTVSGVSPFGFGAALGTNNLVTGEGATVAFFDDELVWATLEAFADQTDTKIVSKPRILVNDNELGSIVSQRQEPKTKFTIAGSGNTTTPVVEFAGYEDAGTTLEITPHISESDFLQLEITLTVDSFEGKGSGNIPPPKTNNQVATLVTIPNGMTIILGGLTSQNDGLTENKVPLLGDIPVLGALFRSVSRSEQEGVLYVFVRAEIVRKPDFSDLDDISDLFRNKLRESELEHDNQSSIIPGIKDKDQSRPSALDEFNKQIRDFNIDDQDKNSANQNPNPKGVNLSCNQQFGKDK